MYIALLPVWEFGLSIFRLRRRNLYIRRVQVQGMRTKRGIESVDHKVDKLNTKGIKIKLPPCKATHTHTTGFLGVCTFKDRAAPSAWRCRTAFLLFHKTG